LGSDIILVTELFPPAIGGSSVLFQNIYRRLEGRVTVLTDSLTASDAASCVEPFRVVRLPMSAPGWGVLHSGSRSRHLRVASRLRTEACNLAATAHCGRAVPEGIAATIARRFYGGPRLVCWAHGEELDYVEHSRELRWLQAKVHHSASAIFANSRNTARKLSALGVPAAKITVVYPGVDARRFSETGCGRKLRERLAPNGEILLLTVGRLQRRKGHDLVVRTLELLKGDFPEMRYVVVGDGEEQDRLQQLAGQLGLRDRIEFVGAVAPDQLPAYYAAADIFVHPNRVDAGEAEGFGIVFLEAAAAGLPTIGGNNGGVPEAIEPGTTGMLVETDDLSELAAAVRTLAMSDSLRRRMGDAGRARVRRQFTWDQSAATVAAVQHELDRSA
jgi:phosphatidylinositol alpha-1,6-mannosyltransferase